MHSLCRWSLASLVAVGLLTCGISGITLGGGGQTFYFDDFNDGNATDGSPMEWDLNPSTGFGPIFPGTYDASSGDLFMEGQDLQGAFGVFDDDDEVLIAHAKDFVFTGDVSVRTRAQLTRFGNIGLLVHNDVTTLSTYYGSAHIEGIEDPNDPGVPVDTGVIELSVFAGGAESNFQEDDAGGTAFPVVAPEDVVVQLDYIGGILQVTYWRAGDAQPTAVASSPVADATYSTGTTGLVFNEDDFDSEQFPGPNSGNVTVRFAKALDQKLIDGDMDLDGDVDFDDIDDFVQGLNDSAGYETEKGVPPLMMGDTDNDGDQDFDDIGNFVTILSGSSSAGIGVPEPSTFVLAGIGVLAVLGYSRRSSRSSRARS